MEKKYAARVRMDLSGAKKPRYFRSERAALVLFRELNQRLMQSGLPTRTAEMTPVRGWEGLVDPAHLRMSRGGGVVVTRKAQAYRSPVAPQMWAPLGGVS